MIEIGSVIDGNYKILSINGLGGKTREYKERATGDTMCLESKGYKSTLKLFAMILIMTVCCGCFFYVSQAYSKTQQENQYVNVLHSVQENDSEISVYGEYWQSLIEFNLLNESETNRELMTLQLYEKIITYSIEDETYFRQDGITQVEIVEIYEDIMADMDKMETKATGQVQEEIDKLRSLIIQAEQIISISYEEADNMTMKNKMIRGL